MALATRPRRPLVTSLALVALLVAQSVLVFAVAAPVSAQEEERTLRRSGSLLPTAANEQLVFTDPAGDAGPFGLEGPPAEDTEFEKIADILSLSVAETEDQFLFKLKHASYDPDTWDKTAGGDGLGDFTCYLRWRVNGQEAVRYTAGFYVSKPDVGQAYLSGWAERREQRGDDRDWEYLGSLAPAIVDDDRIEFTLDKAGFKVGARFRDLVVDDRLTDFTAFCYYEPVDLPFVAIYDSVDEGDVGEGTGRYTVKSATGSDRLALHLDDPGDDEDRRTSRLSVAPGVQKRTAFWVENIGDIKLLANVTATVTDSTGAPLADWTAVVPPVVEVSRDEATKVSIVITAPADATHRDRAKVVIEARALGHDGVVRTKLDVTAALPLGPDQDTLHFHNTGGTYYSCIFVCGGPVATPGVVDASWHYYLMNPLEDDPSLDDEPAEGAAIRLDSYWDMEAGLDVPFVSPVRIDPDERIVLELGIGAQVEREVEIRVDLQGWHARDGVYVGSGTTTATITPGSSTVTVPITPREDALSLPAGTFLWMVVDVEPLVPFFGLADLAVDWYPDATTLTFPFLPVEEAQVNITDGRAFPSIHTANGTDTEEYVNPGKTQVFDLRLVNEGTEKDVLTMDIETDRPDWKVHVEPGNRFRLDPGQAAPLSLVVTAPEDAAEEERLTMNLTATSQNDKGVRTTLRLTALVATDVEIEEEAYVAPAEEDQVDPYVDDTEESPVSPVVPLVALVGLAALLGRRRR